MDRSTITGRYAKRKPTRRADGRAHAACVDGREGEDLEASRPCGETRGDAGLLLREAARAAAERQARCRRRRYLEEAARAPAEAARAERRQAGIAGARRGRRRARGSGAAGARAEVWRPAAAPGARPAGAAAGGAAAKADGEPAAAAGEGRGVPLAEGDDQGAVLGRRGPGAHR